MDKIDTLSPLALAFMGDAVHTAYVRKKVLEGSNQKQANYHTISSSFCNAKRQMQTLEELFSTLSESEREIVRKARNSHSKHIAKNFDEETYKKATAFEALVGYLFLSGKNARLEEILQKSMEENT